MLLVKTASVETVNVKKPQPTSWENKTTDEWILTKTRLSAFYCHNLEPVLTKQRLEADPKNEMSEWVSGQEVDTVAPPLNQ